MTELGIQLLQTSNDRSPAMRFFLEKVELISYLAVGHAAQKGESYSAHTRAGLGEVSEQEHRGRITGRRLRVSQDLFVSREHGASSSALIYGVNYAICFVLIYALGATLATKQPALTASRIAASLERGKDQDGFALLVRAIWRSQFVSFVGNVLGAAACALGIAYLFLTITGTDLIDAAEAETLVSKISIRQSWSLYYAGVAGVMLSVSGMFAGFVDNAVIFHRLGNA